MPTGSTSTTGWRGRLRPCRPEATAQIAKRRGCPYHAPEFTSYTPIGVNPMSSYGPTVNLEQTKKVLAAAEAEAVKQGWNVAIAVVDTAGNLVGFIKRDDTQSASVNVAQDKARTAAL